jgi:ATP-dependent phosphoenolpyruvate carboxykinase
MPKSAKVRKEGSKREREEGRMSDEGANPIRKSSRTGRSPSSKEMDKEMKTMIREIREDTAGIRKDNKVLRKELAAVSEEKEELRKELGAVREEMRGRQEKNGSRRRQIG